MPQFIRILVLGSLALGAACVAVDAARADNFRMETDVFIGSAKEPAVQHLTLFAAEAIYDFRLTAPEEITIVDAARNRVVLLDPSRKLKTTLSTDELMKSAAAIKALADKANPTFYFAANPTFETSMDEANEWLTLTSKPLTYRVRGEKPKQPSMALRYQEFADWSARVSAIRPANLPPFARIQVNKAVGELGWLPTEVERSVAPERFGQRKIEMHSRHMTNWLFSETDKKRIDRAGDYLVSFEAIDFQQYRVEPKPEK